MITFLISLLWECSGLSVPAGLCESAYTPDFRVSRKHGELHAFPFRKFDPLQVRKRDHQWCFAFSLCPPSCASIEVEKHTTASATKNTLILVLLVFYWSSVERSGIASASNETEISDRCARGTCELLHDVKRTCIDARSLTDWLVHQHRTLAANVMRCSSFAMTSCSHCA